MELPTYLRPVFGALATDRVRHVGDPVAVVIAESRAVAEDGCDAVDVDYEPLGCGGDDRTGARSVDPADLRRRPVERLLFRVSVSSAISAAAFAAARTGRDHVAAPPAGRPGADGGPRRPRRLRRRHRRADLLRASHQSPHNLPVQPRDDAARAPGRPSAGDRAGCRWRLRPKGGLPRGHGGLRSVQAAADGRSSGSRIGSRT